MIIRMDLGKKFGRMDHDSREYIKMGKRMEKEFSDGQMVAYMREIL